MSKIVAIHQPNFFPWLGFFDKVIKSDHFVFFDDVYLPKKGGTWTNRVQVIISNNKNWLTVPIDRNFSGQKKINQIKIKNEINWREKLIRSLQLSYLKHPFYSEIFPVIYSLINIEKEYLVEFNIQAIKIILENLELMSDKLVLSSELNQIGSSNQLIVNITKRLKSKKYMCGGGAETYQNETVFEENNIKLIYQNFLHPEYPQYNQDKFIKGLSIIDCLMNLGWEKTSKLLKSDKKSN